MVQQQIQNPISSLSEFEGETLIRQTRRGSNNNCRLKSRKIFRETLITLTAFMKIILSIGGV